MAVFSDAHAVKLAMGQDGRVRGQVTVPLPRLISLDREQVLDLLSVLLVGSDLLMDVGYKRAGDQSVADPTEVVLEVSGDPSPLLEAYG